MRKDLVASAVAIVAFTLVFGLVYPLVMTGISQVAFPDAAGGSRIERAGNGRRLVADRPGLPPRHRPQGRRGEPILEADPRYFQSRPSVTGYNPAGTFFNNLGPNSADLRDLLRKNLDAYLALERPDNPGLRAKDVPVDAVQTSASGVDPHISPANAGIQAHRVARERHAPLDRVRRLVEDNTDGRALGVLGEAGVNVLELNLALDRESPAP